MAERRPDTMERGTIMAERRPDMEEKKPENPPASDSAYTEEEEAEVKKRLEDLGYVE